MELSKAEKERVEKRDIVGVLEMEVRELEARVKLQELKAELDKDPAKVRRVHAIVEKKATTDEKDWTLAELLETISAIKSVLDRGVFVDKLVEPPKAKVQSPSD